MEQLRLIEQHLLAERVKLAVHHESKEMPVFEMTVGRNGPKLKESVEPPAPARTDSRSFRRVPT